MEKNMDLLEGAARYRETINKGIRYIVSEINPDGSMNPREKGAFAFYKIPWALVLSGRYEEAEKVIRRIVEDTMNEEGDLKTEKRQKFHLDYYTYENAWIALAAHLISLFDISFKAWSYIEKFQDPDSGGYCSKYPFRKGGHNLEDPLSSAWVSNAGLHLGKVKEALKAADFIQELWDRQPDEENNFYYYCYSDTGLVLERPENEPEDRFFRINTKEPENWYYILGAQIAFLSKLYLISGRAEHLNLARRVQEFGMRCHEDIFRTDSAGKFCYGNINLYRATGDKKYLDIACRCADYLSNDQKPEGYWMRGGKATASSTAEFCIWLMNVLYLGNNGSIPNVVKGAKPCSV